MLDVISKEEYFSWIESGVTDLQGDHLKHIQDAYILSCIGHESGKRILEMGGGNSRVLRHLSKKNECWNVDKFEGVGAGPKKVPSQRGVHVVQAYLGEFSTDIPENYFDYVVSISVIEHISTKDLQNAFADCARISKPTGMMLHAIDLYLFDKENADHPGAVLTRERVKQYLDYASRPDLGIRMRSEPAITQDVTFSCRYATNSDNTMYQWNKIAPSLIDTRKHAQSVSLKAEWVKIPSRATELET